MTNDLHLEHELPVLPDLDPAEMLAVAERADLALLGLVSCVAIATLVLGAASSLLA
jgi:hypothetical protein